jgi:hypothetical protein
MEKAALEFMTQLVGHRNKVQELLLDLLKNVANEDEAITVIPEFNSIFQLVVGATFCLWRAIVLADEPLEPLPALKHAEILLEKLVRHNAILFSDEKETKRWMCGFYISNIQYRLWHLHQAFGGLLDNRELADFVEKWSPLEFTPEEATLSTFGVLGAFDTNAMFDDAIICLKSLNARILILTTT